MADRRAPIGRLIDVAVALPTCALVAGRRAIPLAARLGTLGTARVIARVSEAVHDLRTAEPTAPSPGDTIPGAAPGQARTATTRPKPSNGVGVDDLPIDGYDDLAARQVVDRLAALAPAELDVIDAYERAHRNRSTVRGKISMLTA
jgi:hypothetical protein